MRRGMGKHPVSVLLDLLFPPRCAFCGRLVEEGDVCAACAEALPFREGAASVQVIGEGRYPCALAFYYEGPVRDGVRALKFGKKSWRARVFARYIAQTAAEELSGGFDAVSFVPVSLRRNFERGFDQARLLADETAKAWNLRAVPTVKKVRDNRRQSSLDSPEDRAENVKNVYRVPHPERVAGKRFLLIDDVLTTGSTISACAAALLEAGAESVVCAALAGGRGPQKGALEGELDASDKDSTGN